MKNASPVYLSTILISSLLGWCWPHEWSTRYPKSHRTPLAIQRVTTNTTHTRLRDVTRHDFRDSQGPKPPSASHRVAEVIVSCSSLTPPSAAMKKYSWQSISAEFQQHQNNIQDPAIHHEAVLRGARFESHRPCPDYIVQVPTARVFQCSVFQCLEPIPPIFKPIGANRLRE